MSEEFGPTFITVTDEDGNEIALEFIDALEHNGQMYQAFFPAETEENEDDPDNGLVILKVRDAGSARGSQASRLPSAAGSWKR